MTDVTEQVLAERLARGIDAHRRGRTDIAEADYRAVIADGDAAAGAIPVLAVAHANLGALLLDQGRCQAAGDYLGHAVTLAPALPESHFNLGRIREMAGDTSAALIHYRDAHRRAPNNAKFLSQLVHAQMKTCDWDALGQRCRCLDQLNRQALAQGRPVAESPFKSIARTDDPALNLAIARSWAADIKRRATAAKVSLPPRPSRRDARIITVGYLSDRFRNAATAHQMLSVFGLHDRRRFRIHVYSYGADDGSVYRRRIAADADRFVDIVGLNDAAVARLIREDGVDILVDLKGHTYNHRLGISALRPAPVQMAYLGFPGSTGADFFDYILLDAVVAPPQMRENFSEAPIYLPHCYYPTDYQQPVDSCIPRRSDLDLPESAIVFCSFNQAFKIDPVMFGCWMSVLRDVPGSVLWLSDGGAVAAANLRREAARQQVLPERLIFAGQLPKAQHLARLRQADLCLDTRVYNGHTTTADALWVGVPVVAMAGRHFASRVSASLLTALGLPELVARDLEAFRELALSLACNHATRTALRHHIERLRDCMPLFDTPRFVRYLEAGFERVWQIHHQQEPPRPINIEGEMP
ncbi:MAG: hypothetical protein ABIL58_29085 [Pseudomonadota bacterium]